MLTVDAYIIRGFPALLLASQLCGAPILELFQKNCGECHSAKIHSSGFSVASLVAVIRGGSKHGRAVVAGQPESSPLIKLLKGEMTPRMPVGRDLAPAEIARIEDWIRTLPPSKDAATVTDWRWPYQKPLKQDPPEVVNTSWVRNPINNFILQKSEAHQLQPAPPASKRVLARRVYFDLIGR